MFNLLHYHFKTVFWRELYLLEKLFPKFFNSLPCATTGWPAISSLSPKETSTTLKSSTSWDILVTMESFSAQGHTKQFPISRLYPKLLLRPARHRALSMNLVTDH